jgi:hypothetical protein
MAVVCCRSVTYVYIATFLTNPNFIYLQSPKGMLDFLVGHKFHPLFTAAIDPLRVSNFKEQLNLKSSSEI